MEEAALSALGHFGEEATAALPAVLARLGSARDRVRAAVVRAAAACGAANRARRAIERIEKGSAKAE